MYLFIKYDIRKITEPSKIYSTICTVVNGIYR
jgi:hypothetical protein